MKRFFTLVLILFTAQAQAIPFEGHQLVMAAPSPHAVETGRKIAAKGGNVVDVAVAMGLTLSVTSPYFAALGGGGFAMVKLNGPVTVLDFREAAPKAMGPDYYLKLSKDASRTGGNAVGVPGFPAGLWDLHKKYGKLPWKELFTDAITLAEKGFYVSGEWVENTTGTQKRFNQTGLKKFFHKDGTPLKPGELLKQPALVSALRKFRAQGPKAFYTGDVAKDVVDAVRASGGPMTLEDLKAYKTRWLEPMTTEYEGHKIYLMPPPSSGGVVITTALHLIEKLDVKSKPMFGADEYHLLGEIGARAFRGRLTLGDPDFAKNPIAYLTSPAYFKELAESVSAKKVVALKPLDERKLIEETTETTHYSVMDANGNAVALTVTLNGDYGSAVVSEKYGIALNNELDDFTTRPGEPNMFGLFQGENNRVQPGKRPLSSMSPTLVEKDGKIVMSLGAPGGPRIISAVYQTIYRVLGRGLDMDAAIQAPRLHHQFLPQTLFLDPRRFAPEVLKELEKRGHQPKESYMGKIYGVRMRPDGILEAAFDARGEGAAGGR